MQAGNTRQARWAINKAFDKLKHQKGNTWTDPVRWCDYNTPMRVVTYATIYAKEIAEEANKTLRTAGFNNEVRVTDTDIGFRGGSGPYIRVNANLP